MLKYWPRTSSQKEVIRMLVIVISVLFFCGGAVCLGAGKIDQILGSVKLVICTLSLLP